MTISLFDPASNAARVLAFQETKLVTMEPPGVVSAAVNGASFAAGAPLAPGSIASAFGTNLSSSGGAASSVPWPTTLGGATVQMNGITAPLVYVSPTQINFQVPWELAGQPQANLVISGSQPLAVQVAPVSPGIFAIVQQERYLILYCTGLGEVANRPATGAAGSGSPPSTTTATPGVTVANESATVAFSGLAPGFVGVYQVNVQIPVDVASGASVPVVVTLGGATSNSVTVKIQ